MSLKMLKDQNLRRNVGELVLILSNFSASADITLSAIQLNASSDKKAYRDLIGCLVLSPTLVMQLRHPIRG